MALDGFSRRQAKSYVRAKHLTGHHEVAQSNSARPGGLLSGIGMWSGSNMIPGTHKVKHNDNDIFQLPVQKLRRIKPSSPVIVRAARLHLRNDQTSARTIELPPLFQHQEIRRCGLLSGHEPVLKAKQLSHGTTQAKPNGLWNRSIGSPMGPTEWIGE